jgi:hypothetical protein
MKVDFRPDGDAENGLWSMNASATVTLDKEEQPNSIEEMQLSGYVFIPNTVNGKKVSSDTETKNDLEVSWPAAAILNYIKQYGEAPDGKYELDGVMEC